jgi:hypothetical protein
MVKKAKTAPPKYKKLVFQSISHFLIQLSEKVRYDALTEVSMKNYYLSGWDVM